MKTTPLIQSVERALDIIELVSTKDTPLRSIDIAAELGLNTNTVNNLLRTLYIRGYLAQTPNRQYQLGPRCHMLGNSSDKWAELREISAEILRALSIKTNDLSFLGVMEAGQLICAAMAEGTGTIVVSAKQAWSDRPHCSATGKILLAALPENRRTVILKNTELKKFTAHTITDREQLERQLHEIKDSNFSLCRDEAADGISALAVPVYGKNDEIMASLGSSFPTFFLDSGKIKPDKRVATLHSFAAKISESIKKISGV